MKFHEPPTGQANKDGRTHFYARRKLLQTSQSGTKNVKTYVIGQNENLEPH